jgi:hypothetical protein
MKKIVLSGLVLCSSLLVQAQSIDKIITVKKVTEVEKYLLLMICKARAFTPELIRLRDILSHNSRKKVTNL